MKSKLIIKSKKKSGEGLTKKKEKKSILKVYYDKD